MGSSQRDTEDRFLAELKCLKVHHSPQFGPALKKQLLLLLVLSRIRSRGLVENRIRFEDIQGELSDLICEYGGRPVDSGPKPEQPFCHLRNSSFWEVVGLEDVPQGKTASPGVLGRERTYACLSPPIFALLGSSERVLRDAVEMILEKWWGVEVRDRLRRRLDLDHNSA